MTAIKNISIPDTCNQQWQQMTRAGEGRYCNSCCKTVTDFTAMSNEEIIRYVSANEHVCGRFEESQLIRINQILSLGRNCLLDCRKWGLAFVLLALSPVVKAEKRNNGIVRPLTIMSNNTDTLVAKHATLRNGKLNINDSTVVNNNIQFKNDTVRVVLGGVIVGRRIHTGLWYKFKGFVKSVFD